MTFQHKHKNFEQLAARREWIARPFGKLCSTSRAVFSKWRFEITIGG